MAAHRKLAADFGHQADAVVQAARERMLHQESPSHSLNQVRDSLTFSRDKNFEREAVVDERALIRDGLRRGMGDVTYAQFRGNLDARLASGEFQTVEREHMPGRQFTTARTIAAEQEIVRRVLEGRNQVEPVLSRSQAIAVADQHLRLNSTQKSVIEDVLSLPDRVQGIQGYAGSGKTTTLAAIRSAAEMQGYHVEGFAPTSRAARQLGEAGVGAGTLQGFLARLTTPTPPEQKHFYFLDESSLANRVKEIPDPDERIRAIAKSYTESPETTLIVSPDNASRRELNLAVRQELKANGTVAADDHSFRTLVQRQEMTGADRSRATHYEVNDVVRYARGSRNAGIEA
jgi:hypothetical protein